jgi:hypothetical protein
MNRAAARFTSSAPSRIIRGAGEHGVPRPYDGKGWRSEDRRYEFKNRRQLLPGSMILNRPLQIQKQIQRQRGYRLKCLFCGAGEDWAGVAL